MEPGGGENVVVAAEVGKWESRGFSKPQFGGVFPPPLCAHCQSQRRASYENWLREWIAAVNVLDTDEETNSFLSGHWSGIKKKGKAISSNRLWNCRVLPSTPPLLLSRD